MQYCIVIIMFTFAKFEGSNLVDQVVTTLPAEYFAFFRNDCEGRQVTRFSTLDADSMAWLDEFSAALTGAGIPNSIVDDECTLKDGTIKKRKMIDFLPCKFSNGEPIAKLNHAYVKCNKSEYELHIWQKAE